MKIRCSLRRTLYKRKLSTTDLAKKLTALGYKISRASVWNWASGKNIPDGNTIYIVAAVLRVPPEKLMKIVFDKKKTAFWDQLINPLK